MSRCFRIDVKLRISRRIVKNEQHKTASEAEPSLSYPSHSSKDDISLGFRYRYYNKNNLLGDDLTCAYSKYNVY
jgi:hypothetical protein